MEPSLIMEPFPDFGEDEDRFSDHADFYDNNLVIPSTASSEIGNGGHILKDGDMELPVAIHLGARFLALQTFKSDILDPPTNQTWMFLFLHQLVLEAVAVKNPVVCGFEGKSIQTIQTLINRDLKRLCGFKMGTQVDGPTLKHYKVSPDFNFLLLIILEICVLFLELLL